MESTVKFCLIYLLMWHQVNASSISSLTFKKTSQNMSLLGNIEQKSVHVSGGLISCGLECNQDKACYGFGYRKLLNEECLVIKTTHLNTTNLYNTEGFAYYLLADLPSHCGEVSNHESGLALLQLGDGQLIVVYCDQEVNYGEGGGWLVFQQRLDGSENFYRNWMDYKVGFGNPSAEFWIGNDNLHQLTKNGNAKLLIELEDKTGVKLNAKYSTFIVDSEAMKYQLEVSGYEGGDPPGDSMSYQDGMKFTTYDDDNDIDPNLNCASVYTGAWWYKSCHVAHLNGLYASDEVGIGINWYTWQSFTYSLPFVRMMVKF